MDIKRLAAGVIAGAAIAAAPVLALAAPASAATNAANPAAAAATHQRMQDQLGSGSGFARASHAMPCGGGINCDYCGCR